MTKYMSPMPSAKLGPQARRFLATMASGGRRLLRTEEAYEFWPSTDVARQALSRLVRSGWLERIERGLYLIVPLEAGPEGHWTEDPMVIAAQLVPSGAVGYWSALHYWGMTEQIPRTVFVQSRSRKHRSQLTLLGIRYQFIHIVERKFFGTVKQWTRGIEFTITDREKTLVDALDRPDLCGGIPALATALTAGAGMDWDVLDGYLRQFGSGAVFKRLGYLAEALDVPIPEAERRIAAWRKQLSQGTALLDPRGPRKGPIDSRWRVRVNLTGLVRKR